MDSNRIFCHLCNKDMTDDKSETQFWFIAHNVDRHYCGECGKNGELILNEFYKRVKRLEKNGEYCDPYDEIKLIESLYKNRNGSLNISFKNNYNYDESVVNAPILKDGKPVGIITSVTPEKVEGFIWERYMPIVTEFNNMQKAVSFEIVY